MYHVTRLESGLRVATVEMPHMVGVSVGLFQGIGSRYEPEHLNGACHFIEHLLFKGTRKRSAKEISEAVEGIGGYLNAFTAEETTCFHARAAHSHFAELLNVLIDMVLNSRFAPAEIAKERDVIKEEMAMYLDEPQHQVQEVLNATLWPDHPLGRSITGTNQTLDAMRRKHLLDYLRANYVTGGTVIVAAGNVKHRQVLRHITQYERHFPRGSRPGFSLVRGQQRAPQVRLFRKQAEQTQIALGFRTCSRHDQRRYALRLLNTILGENMSSRLFQVVREQHGLAYSIYSTPTFFEDAGDLVISAGLDTESLPKTLRLIMRELRRIAQKPARPAELRRARDYLFGQIDLGQESTDNQMNWVGEQLLGYDRIFSPADLKRRLARVTAAEIRAVAAAFFQADRLNLAMVSPLKSASHVKQFLVL